MISEKRDKTPECSDPSDNFGMAKARNRMCQETTIEILTDLQPLFKNRNRHH